MDFEVVGQEELPFEIDAGGEEPFVYEGYRITAEADDTTLHLFGIMHTPAFNTAYDDVVQTYMEGADAAIIESPADLLGIGTNVEPFMDTGYAGFKPYTRMAKENDALLHVADPISTGTHLVDEAATFFGRGAAVAGILLPAWRRIRSHLPGRLERERGAVAGTRREFLQSAGMLVGGGYLYGTSTKGSQQHAFIDGLDGDLEADDPVQVYGWDDRLSMGEVDYRNVVSAARIERIVEAGEAEEYVAVYGGAHTGDILGYLQEDPTRMLKRAAYTPADLLGEDLHTYEVRNGRWMEIDFPEDIQDKG